DLPMTLSEGIYTSINVDIGGLHQGQNISINETLPMIHSEQVGISGATDVLWGGQACRDPINRKYYRRTIWKGFFEGGSGSIECSLPFSGTAPFTTMADFLADSNVRNVMEDHGRLATLISLFKNDLTQLIPLSSSNLGSTPSSIKLRALSGSEYVGYFYGGLPSAGASITLSLPAGSFVAQWFSPSSGSISAMETVASGNTLTSPWGSEFDAILHVYSSAYVNMTLPTKVQGAQLTKTVK
ncbi:MAG: hypothetical protein OEX00_08625, partial [Gammaproteobacteria bacterium]|nr:hypothetical protein [Gammaproteobacteria bacterium]